MKSYKPIKRHSLSASEVCIAFLRSERAFVAKHMEQRAINAQYADEYKLARAHGEIPHVGSEDAERLAASEERRGVLHALQWSATVTLLSVSIALLIGVATGAVHPSLPMHVGKLLQATGGALGVWGTLLAVLGPGVSWSGERASEKAHRVIFTGLLFAGGSIAIAGTLISP
jgi:hypothetical protein